MENILQFFSEKKEIVTPSLHNFYKDFILMFKMIDECIINATSDNNVLTPITLRCPCIKEKTESKILYGCTDKHVFDVVTISYFTLGTILCTFFSSSMFPLLILSFWKLLRTCGNINEALFSYEITELYGNQRKYQTLINIFGDIFALYLGYLFSYTLSWPIVLPIIIIINIVAASQGGDFISFFCWMIDRLGYINKRKRYISSSSLEKYAKRKLS